MNQYSSLAPVYDKLNSQFNYKAVADYIEKQFGEFSKIKTESVLDLACGTGNVTVELARRGYDMTGIDLSEEMLCIARDKCDSERFRHGVLLVRQNMADFELYGTVNGVVCCLDSLNYLLTTDELKRTFLHVYNYLDEGGVFVFDMNTPYKFENIYADNSYILEDEGVFCAWQNEYSEKTKKCRFYLSVFEEAPNGQWERFDEIQTERCYSMRTVKKLLSECGFELCSLHSDTDGNPVAEDSERWYFTVRKNKEN